MFRNVPKDSGYLFASRDLREVLIAHAEEMRQEVERLESNRLLNTAPTDLSSYLAQKYTLTVPVLELDQMVADEQEVQVDVRYDSNRWIRDQSRPVYIPGQRIDVSIPFTGESELFYCRASTQTTNPPRASIKGNTLVLVYQIAHDVQTDLRSEIDGAIANVQKHLEWSRNDVQNFNSKLFATATQAIEDRRRRLLQNQGRLASLGIPLKKREGAPATYAVPTVRRKVAPTLPAASTVPYTPEPALDMANYEHILSVIQNMTMVMERSPSSFAGMGEEDLRQHFLVQLNGQFEGNATGETFNGSGKTDILLRYEGRNVFIAECKFWKGPKGFAATIDQLLGYTSWRDTKTAILVFNRGTALSSVLAGIDEVARQHPNYKRTEAWNHETGFRYVFHHNDDKNRELLATVLVFEVPAKS